MRDVFLTFLRLGSTSFGGPIAHLGYFRREFVERRAWLDEDTFAHIVAFCSILPGPTSSQVGMIVGLLRAGPAGAFAAWLGFTLPSALVLATAAAFVTTVEHGATTPAWFGGALTGLSAAATAIVALAVLALARSQCPDSPTRTIAAGAAILALALAAQPAGGWLPIAAGALAGIAFGTRPADGAPAEAAPRIPLDALRLPQFVAPVAGMLFVVLVAAAAVLARTSAAGVFLATIVRAGSLVFGGGHVVLPLLQSLVPAGLIAQPIFSAGYGITQAVPGPLFTFAAFLGSANASALHGAAGAAIATALIFLPSFLLIFAVLPAFEALRANRAAAGALRGANAAVVGLLGAVLYSPLLTSLGTSVWRIALALGVFTLVGTWKIAPWIAVVAAAAAGGFLAAANVRF